MLGPGDAVVVCSGRESYQAAHRDAFLGAPDQPSPGLHASCLRFLRDHDVAVLAWDMMDARPNEYGLAWAVHPAIYSFGVAFIDNALLEPLAEACAEERRHEFLLIVAPLNVPPAGPGSPVNPLAVF